MVTVTSYKTRYFASAALLAVGVTLAACSTPAELKRPLAASAAKSEPATVATAAAPAQAPAKQPARNKNLAVVQVFYATDRSPTGASSPAKAFGAGRGTLSYGSCEVTVLRDPRMARLEAASVWKLDHLDGHGRTPSLRRLVPHDNEPYLEGLRAAIARGGKKSALVLVPGYNVSFAEAARRTAQIKYDLAFDGAAIFFSWPSRGKAEAYAADEADVEWAQPDLKQFLKDLAGKTTVRNIYLIGHGLGNRALAKAFVYLASERPELARLVREIILVAPDIDADLFYRDIAPGLAGSSVHTTLYASSRDPELRAATKSRNYPRAGHSGDPLLIADGIETVDATGVDTALAGHRWLGDRSSVLADIYPLIRHGKGAADRPGMRSVKVGSGSYWKLKGK